MTNAEALFVVGEWLKKSKGYGPVGLAELVHDAIAFQAKKAGKASTLKKRQAVRLNGLKGGRPKNAKSI